VVIKLADEGRTAVTDGGDSESLFSEITVVHVIFAPKQALRTFALRIIPAHPL
jgi:hypothetical protein